MHFLQKRDIRTDGRTDGPTDGRTHPLIKSWLTTKNDVNEARGLWSRVHATKNAKRHTLFSLSFKDAILIFRQRYGQKKAEI